MLASFLTLKFFIFSFNFSLLFSMYFCHYWSITTIINWADSPTSLLYTVPRLGTISRSSGIAYISALDWPNQPFRLIIRCSNGSIWSIRRTHIWILMWIRILSTLWFHALIIMNIIQLFEYDIFWRRAQENDSKGNQHKDLKIEGCFPL